MRRTTPRAPARPLTTHCAVLALTLGLAACSDGPADPAGSGEVVMRFSYQGVRSGTFEARGDVRPEQGMLDHTYAFGQRYQNPPTLEISGVLQRPGNLVDGVRVRIPRAAAGSVAIDSASCPWWDEECAGVTVLLELPNQNGAQARYSCTLATGTIRLTAVSASRASGEFAGSGDCIDRDATTGEGVPLTVSGGRFEVRLYGATRG